MVGHPGLGIAGAAKTHSMQYFEQPHVLQLVLQVGNQVGFDLEEKR